MPRLMVKNIPNTETEGSLRKLFCQQGALTEVQLKQSPHGTFKRFAFIGYYSEADAGRAVKTFNNAYLGGNKLMVMRWYDSGGSRDKSWRNISADTKMDRFEPRSIGGYNSNEKWNRSPYSGPSFQKADQYNDRLDAYKGDYESSHTGTSSGFKNAGRFEDKQDAYNKNEKYDRQAYSSLCVSNLNELGDREYRQRQIGTLSGAFGSLASNILSKLKDTQKNYLGQRTPTQSEHLGKQTYGHLDFKKPDRFEERHDSSLSASNLNELKDIEYRQSESGTLSGHAFGSLDSNIFSKLKDRPKDYLGQRTPTQSEHLDRQTYGHLDFKKPDRFEERHDSSLSDSNLNELKNREYRQRQSGTLSGHAFGSLDSNIFSKIKDRPKDYLGQRTPTQSEHLGRQTYRHLDFKKPDRFEEKHDAYIGQHKSRLNEHSEREAYGNLNFKRPERFEDRQHDSYIGQYKQSSSEYLKKQAHNSPTSSTAFRSDNNQKTYTEQFTSNDNKNFNRQTYGGLAIKNVTRFEDRQDTCIENYIPKHSENWDRQSYANQASKNENRSQSKQDAHMSSQSKNVDRQIYGSLAFNSVLGFKGKHITRKEYTPIQNESLEGQAYDNVPFKNVQRTKGKQNVHVNPNGSSDRISVDTKKVNIVRQEIGASARTVENRLDVPRVSYPGQYREKMEEAQGSKHKEIFFEKPLQVPASNESKNIDNRKSGDKHFGQNQLVPHNNSDTLSKGNNPNVAPTTKVMGKKSKNKKKKKSQGPIIEIKKKDKSELSDLVRIKLQELNLPRAMKYFTFFKVKVKNLPGKTRPRHIREFFHPLPCYRVTMPRHAPGLAFVGFVSEWFRSQALLRDKCYLSGNRVSVVAVEMFRPENEGRPNPRKNRKVKRAEVDLRIRERLALTGRIRIKKLAYSITKDDIEKLFGKYGPIKYINLPIDNRTKLIKGFGVVQFVNPDDAIKAYVELDAIILHGQTLCVRAASDLLPNEESTECEQDESEMQNTQKRQEEAKANWSSQKRQEDAKANWSSLFIDHNMIVEKFNNTNYVVEEPHRHSKSAVKLAKAKSEIRNETKMYLEQMGVKLDAFNSENLNKSNTVILVRYLPSKTDSSELRDVLDKHGRIGRIVLPTSGKTAMVEFLDPSEAKNAFTKLALSKFKNTSLNLEWAPLGSLEGNDVEDTGDKATKESLEMEIPNNLEDNLQDKDRENSLEKEQNNLEEDKFKDIREESDSGEKKTDSNQEQLINDKDDKGEPEPDTTICVKNLNFNTTSDDLKKHFEACGKVFCTSINVRTVINKNKETTVRSTGSGFIRYMEKSSTIRALQELQNSILNGRALKLTLSAKIEKGDLKEAPKDSKISAKISVKNIPLKAIKTDIENVFRTFKGVKMISLPASHRGYGSIEFNSENNAKIAFDALSNSTNLFGNQLVLEYAVEDNTLQQNRKRTADHLESPEQENAKKNIIIID